PVPPRPSRFCAALLGSTDGEQAASAATSELELSQDLFEQRFTRARKDAKPDSSKNEPDFAAEAFVGRESQNPKMKRASAEHRNLRLDALENFQRFFVPFIVWELLGLASTPVQSCGDIEQAGQIKHREFSYIVHAF